MSRIHEQLEHERVRRVAQVSTTVIKGGFIPLSEGASRASKSSRGGGLGRRSGYAPRSKTQTVVKANFRRAGFSTSNNRGRLERSLEYYSHRPNSDGERQNRPIFGAEGELTPEEAHAMIQESEAEYGYRLVLSPGKDMDADQLEDWATALMDELEEDGTVTGWVGVAHDDQTEHPHAHVIAMTSRRLDGDDFRALRLEGDLEAERVMLESWTARLESEFEAERYSSSGQQIEAEGGGEDEVKKVSELEEELYW